MSNDEWKIVPRRKARKFNAKQTSTYNASEYFDEADIERKYNEAKTEVGGSRMLLINSEALKEVSQINQHLSCIKKAIVFGLGSLASKRSRIQLALLAKLIDIFPSISKKEIFDPVFTNNDRSFLQKLGYSILQSNEDCGYMLTCSSLVFMPHMEVIHYESFLAANKENPSLTESILLCNSLSKYVNLDSEGGDHQNAYKTIEDIISRGNYKEIPFKEEDMKKSFAFNDMSVQYFANGKDH